MKTMFRKFVRPAFTLIELVITIVVIGILSAALVATYSDVSGSAKKAAQQASLSALQSQIAIHLAAYPLHLFPTMYDLKDEVANLRIASTTTPATLDPMIFSTNVTAFNLYDSAGVKLTAANLATAPYFFFIPTPAGSVVILAFSDPFCRTPVNSPDTIEVTRSLTNFMRTSPVDPLSFTPKPADSALVQCVRIPYFSELNDTTNKTTIDALPLR